MRDERQHFAVNDISPGGDEVCELMLYPEQVPQKGDVIGISDASPEQFYEVVQIVWFTTQSADKIRSGSGSLYPTSIEVKPVLVKPVLADAGLGPLPVNGCIVIAERLEDEKSIHRIICAQNIFAWVEMGVSPFSFMIPLCEKHQREHQAFHILEKS